MEQVLQQLKSDSSDAITFAGHSLTYTGMALCGLFVVLGLLAGKGWKYLARPRQNVRGILHDPRRRASEASVVVRARKAGM